ncbi:MAG TPA: FecR domain-containing protein, partial [Cytophagales bacterium]
MKKKVPHLLLAVGLAGLCLYPAYCHSQTVATIAARPAQASKQRPGVRVPLRQALMQLKEQYNVNVLFEEKLLEDVYTSGETIHAGKKIEENLRSLLRKTGLQFKKIDAETYLILAPKAETAPAPRTGSDPGTSLGLE